MEGDSVKDKTGGTKEKAPPTKTPSGKSLAEKPPTGKAPAMKPPHEKPPVAPAGSSGEDKVAALLNQRLAWRQKAEQEGRGKDAVLHAELVAIDRTLDPSNPDDYDGLAQKLKQETEANHRVINTLEELKKSNDDRLEKISKLEQALGKKKDKTTAVALRPAKYITGSTDIREYLARFRVYVRASNIREDDWSVVDLLTSYLDTRSQKRVLRMELDKRGIEVEEALQAIVKELEEVSPKSKARAKMYEISQREGERISDVATRIVEKRGYSVEG